MLLIAIILIFIYYYHPIRKQTLKIEKKCVGQTPVLRFIHNDKYVYFILDTGCSRSLINKSVVDSFKGIRRSDIDVSMQGIGGNSIASEIITTSLTDDFSNTYIVNFMISDALEGIIATVLEDDILVSGILGVDFMQNYNLSIDFKNLNVYMNQ